MILVRSPRANWSQRGQGPDSVWFRRPHVTSRRMGPTSGARPGRKDQQRAPGGLVCHGARPGSARMSNVAPPPSSRGATTCRTHQWGRVRCHLDVSDSGRPRRPRPGQQRLTLGTWNITSLEGKELVQEMERYQLDLVGLTSTHSWGSGSKILDSCWTLFFSGVAKGVRCRGVWGHSQAPG